MKAIAVIPTYNEKSNIQRLIERILEQDRCLQVIVVDDNSPDGTGKIVDAIAAVNDRVAILHRKEKSGLGSAYRDGFKQALAMGADLIIEMDADFSHDPENLGAFLEKMQDYDFVIGSRYLNGVSVVNWPIRRLMLSYFASVYTRFITGMRLSDCTSGFKCFRRQVIEAVGLDNIKSDGYSFQIEMNYKCIKMGFKAGEIPIIFIDRHAGTSKMSKKIVREAVLMVWKLRIGSLFHGRLRSGALNDKRKLGVTL